MTALLLLLFSSSFAAVTDLRVKGATSTQIVIAYTAPDAGACIVEASPSASYTPLALDVDPAFYASSNMDSRGGTVRIGRYREFVIGKQGPSAIELAIDGWYRSRALRADTAYFLRVTCGVDTASIPAKTANIYLGDSRGEAIAVAGPFQYKQISQNPVAVTEYNDPYTGTLAKNYSNLRGHAYAASTVDSALMAVGGSDCAQTLTGVKGSCKFEDASGPGWSPTSTTLTAAVRADDAEYAEYSGTSQQVLFVRLGRGKTPDNTSFGEFFSWQNLIIRGLTTSTTGGGGDIEVCWTLDGDSGVCDSPWRTVSLTTSEATYRVCHDSPCTNAEKPGDFGTFKDPSLSSTFGRSRIYNVAGSLSTIRFVGEDATADCNRLYVGETLAAHNTNDDNASGLTIASKSCGSTPPQVTINESPDLTHNGTTGGGYFVARGIGSARYGVLIRKKSTSATSTVKIGYVLWRAAWSIESYLNFASGGFGKKCQTVPTASGYYLCITGHPSFILGLKPGPDGVDIKNYGVPSFRGDLLLGSHMKAEWTTCTTGGNDMTWDDVTPGRLYCGMPTAYPNPAAGGAVDYRIGIVMIDLGLTERTFGDPDGYATNSNGTGADAAAAALLTPCLNSCLSTSDDYTPIAQVRRNYAAFDVTRFPSCALGAPQGNSIFFGCSAGSQNSAAWSFVFDLGNRLPIGSGYVGSHGSEQIYGGVQSSNTPLTRWCNVHTGQAPASAGGTAGFTVPEVSAGGCIHFVQSTNSLSTCSANANPGTCSACPDVTLYGYNYNGKNWCSTLGITSSWDGAWGAQPGDWSAGMPVQSGCSVSPNLHYLHALQVGDFISHNGELLLIVAKSGNTLTVVRGFGSWFDNISYGTKAHNSGDSFFPVCYSLPGDPTKDNPGAERGSMVWHYNNDPTGQDTNYTFLTNYHNHACHFNDGVFNYGIVPNKSVTVSNGLLAGKWQTAAEYKALFDGTGQGTAGTPDSDIGWAESFAGKGSACYGNACETHPGAQHVRGDSVAKSWFHDARPRLFHPGASVSITVTPVAGKTSIYSVSGSGFKFDPKHYDQEVFSGSHPLQRVDTLLDGSAGRGTWCYPVVTNDCFTGSVAGMFYFSNDVYDTSWSTKGMCRESLFNPLQADNCAGNSAGHSNSYMQVAFPEANGLVIRNNAYGRAVGREGLYYHASATTNVHSDPTGTVLLTRGFTYLVPPRFPGKDGRNRGTFLAVPVNVSSVPPGTSTVVVQFGYNEAFQCSRNRDNSCYAEGSAVNNTTPYKFDHEALTGVSCASGCTPVVPAISNRVLYYRPVFRDSGGAIISKGSTETIAVN